MRKKDVTPVILILVLMSLVFVTPLSHAGEIKGAATPKNIILFIGDGMGVAHITAGKIEKGELNLERFRHVGLVTTYSNNALVTDSAAAATALATGYKTNNRAISMTPQQVPLKTVVEYAEERGKSTGLVVTCAVTHATPAAFVSHVMHRREKTLIAEHIVSSGIDVLFGGGWAYFVPSSVEGSKREDGKDLLETLSKRMKIVRTGAELQKVGSAGAVAGFFAAEHLPAAKERKPSLRDLTKIAINTLSRNSHGFFLLVEGSQIDWASHENNQQALIAEMVDFDDAVGIGLGFAQRDINTLVIVIADHETGGFAIHQGSVSQRTVTESGFTSSKHTATMVPLFAYGPGSTALTGIQDNTDVGQTMIRFLQE